MLIDWDRSNMLIDWDRFYVTFNACKTGHFRDVLPNQFLGLVLKELNPTQQKEVAHENEKNKENAKSKTHA